MQHALDLSGQRMRWSAYQQAIFDAVEDIDGGNLAVRARAGTGKTTTICEAIRHMPRRGKILVCAFNRDIRDTLASKLPMGVDVLTTHGLGLRALKAGAERSRHDKDKLKRMVGERWPAIDAGPWRSAATKLIARAKATLARTHEEIDATVDAAGICLEDLVPRARRSPHGLSPDQAAELRALLVEACSELLLACGEAVDAHDFDDMLWLPVVHGWSPGRWDWVVVDEAQDLSRVQLELIASALAPGGRLLVVGDDRQAIYRFRGADARAFDALAERFGCRILPLSITYRCPTSVVDLARKLVPDYEAGEGAPAGEVGQLGQLDPRALKPGDFVISRKNAPLVRHAIAALAAGVPAAIAGRDLAKDLGTILAGISRRCGGNRERVISTLTEHYQRRLAEASKRDLDPGPIGDELDCLLALLDAREVVQESIDLLDKLCTERPENVVLFSSVHKAKGLERDRVFLLMGTFRASFSGHVDPRAGKRGDSAEELNLLYVAATRAKRSLVLVAGEG